MSPRAAWRLEGLGFEEVYDYVPGKADWSASGFPIEGTAASVAIIGDAAWRDVPTCAPTEKVGGVRDRTQQTGWDRCVVVNEERVVLGMLREKEMSVDPDTIAEVVMRNGPATFRPDEPAQKIAKRMRERGASAVVVTTSDGRLMGLLYREDAERVAVDQM